MTTFGPKSEAQKDAENRSPEAVQLLNLIRMLNDELDKVKLDGASEALKAAVINLRVILYKENIAKKIDENKRSANDIIQDIEKGAVSFQKAILALESKSKNTTSEPQKNNDDDVKKQFHDALGKFLVKIEPMPPTTLISRFKAVVGSIKGFIKNILPQNRKYNSILGGMKKHGIDALKQEQKNKEDLLEDQKNKLKKEKIAHLKPRFFKASDPKKATKLLIELFNLKPSEALKAMKERNDDIQLETPEKKLDTNKIMARFLHPSHSDKNIPELDKNKIGEFLGEEDSGPKPAASDDPSRKLKKGDLVLNGDSILEHYFNRFDFKNKDFVEGMRDFLTAFRLPGEAQKINRIVAVFANKFCKDNPSVFANPDAAYVLAYAIIMLNTDAHNPQVKTKMSLDDFIRNNRGINDGKDFDKAFMEKIYNSITKNEIKMKDEAPKVGIAAKNK